MPGVIDVLSSVHSVLLPHCSNDDDDAWDPVDKNELEHAEPAEPTSNNAIEQMVLDEEDSPPFLNVSYAGVPVCLAAYEER